MQLKTVKEFASLLRVHATTVRRAILAGRIQAFRVGFGKRSSWRIPYTELQRMAVFDLMDVVDKEAKKKAKERK